MKEIFGIDPTMRNTQAIGRMRRHRPSRIASAKVKRGPAKGKTIKMSVHPCIAVLMMSCLKRRRGSGYQMMSAEELNRRQMQMHRDSYRMASAMNSGDLK